MMMHKLFSDFGHRYDLHTPPSHYQHDHQLVLQLAAEFGPHCCLLDVGCGTGVLLEKARAAGIDAHGLDASPTMVESAKRRVPSDTVRVLRMQDIVEHAIYDVVVSLSWSIHYCEDLAQFRDVLIRLRSAVKPGGLLLLQVAHGPNLSGRWLEDAEPGPAGEVNDVILRYRFRSDGGECALADYEYRCSSKNEEFSETHQLVGTDANAVSAQLNELGFVNVAVWDSWRRDELKGSGIVFVHARLKSGPT